MVFYILYLVFFYNLLLGQPFYGGSDNKPLCQTCYTNTLEKCCKCSKPILDRILRFLHLYKLVVDKKFLLRATGKPYHPSCFTCVVCQKSLDGIPFTVDATNQIHCIEDFHRRCAKYFQINSTLHTVYVAQNNQAFFAHFHNHLMHIG